MSELQNINQENAGKMEFGKILPGGADIPEPVKLTEEEDQGLIGILTQAKAAEKAGDFQNAVKFYDQYRDQYENLRIEKLPEETAEKLNLHEQYESQIKILTETGILQELSDGSQGVIGIDDKEYPVPSFEDIKAKLTPEKSDFLKKKQEQGFSKLLLVPFGMKLDDLIGKYGEFLLKKDLEGKLLATDGSKLDLDRNKPVDMYGGYENSDNTSLEELVYEPQSFDANHKGKTKRKLINEGSPWQIELIEDWPDLPAQGDGETVGGRLQLEANRSARDYLDEIMTNPSYMGEKGLNPETWLIYAMTSLEEGKGQIDDSDGQGKGSFLTGVYFAGGRTVPHCYWDRRDHQAYLGNLHFGGPLLRTGCRTMVEI